MYVRGLNQFVNMNGYEIADMKLLNTPKGYYMRFTVFIDKNKINDCVQMEESIGIDFRLR